MVNKESEKLRDMTIALQLKSSDGNSAVHMVTASVTDYTLVAEQVSSQSFYQTTTPLLPITYLYSHMLNTISATH